MKDMIWASGVQLKELRSASGDNPDASIIVPTLCTHDAYRRFAHVRFDVCLLQIFCELYDTMLSKPPGIAETSAGAMMLYFSHMLLLLCLTRAAMFSHVPAQT